MPSDSEMLRLKLPIARSRRSQLSPLTSLSSRRCPLTVSTPRVTLISTSSGDTPGSSSRMFLDVALQRGELAPRIPA